MEAICHHCNLNHDTCPEWRSPDRATASPMCKGFLASSPEAFAGYLFRQWTSTRSGIIGVLEALTRDPDSGLFAALCKMEEDEDLSEVSRECRLIVEAIDRLNEIVTEAEKMKND